ncbi:PREDICTED: D(1)-like dopamine receptor, partial [Gavialis gangeticus]|uniref:D(1)-like dopamine receptor n=1 Tax=Gavialis gangeticus TaxID=94835 RepID=UPI00092FB016
ALVLGTLLGNALVCAAVLRCRRLRARLTNWFVLSLAAADLCVGALVMPWRAVTELAGGAWLFGSRFCDTWVAFDIMCSTASILHLCLISLDRYWAIASPFRYQRGMTRCLAATMIAVAWALSLLISFVPVQLHWHRAGGDGDAGPLPRCDTRLNRPYAVTSSLVSFYIPVAVVIATYARIYRIARAQIRRISSLEQAGGRCPSQDGEPASSLRKEAKVLQTLALIVGVFVCCWLPFFVLNCLVPFCQPRDEDGPQEPSPCVGQTTFNVFVWFGWANSSVNPAIYAFNADFRRAFGSLLGCPCLHRSAASSAVERVNFSKELVSYHRAATCHKEGVATPPLPPPAVTAWAPPVPHDVSLQGEEESSEGPPLGKRPGNSLLQAAHSNSPRSLHLPALLQFECEAEVSLETITPCTGLTVTPTRRDKIFHSSRT